MNLQNSMEAQNRPAYSIPSLLAVASAIGSLFVGAGAGLLLAVLAIALGAIGILLSLLPQRRGGIVSALSMMLGVLKAPVSKLVRTLAEPAAKLVRTVAAVQATKAA